MNRYISLLRGINVSGQKKIKMDVLKVLYESLDLKEVRTFIQSGNVIFLSSESGSAKLAARVEKKIKQAFNFEVVVFIRTEQEFEKLIAKNPLAKLDENKLHVTFLSDFPPNIPTEEIEKVKGKSERFSISGREIYLFCSDGYGRTKLSNNFFERKLKMPATTRNWKTVKALCEMARGESI